MKKIISLGFITLILTSASSVFASSGAPCYGAILAGARRLHNNNNKGYCDYSNAANNGGWGWNSATQTACAPQNGAANCDFSNAANNGGWGWNPVTQTSCR